MRKVTAICLSLLLLTPTMSFAAGNEKNQPKESEKSSKSEWSLVWSDEFEGNEIDRTKWTYDLGNWIVDEAGNGAASGWGNNEKQFYTDSSENSYVKDGKLIIQAKKEQSQDKFGTYDYTSARLKTKGLFSKKYGRFEIKARLPVGKGLWPAFWMLPENDKYGGWAASGEIDIMESWGSRPHTVAGTIHYGGTWPNNKHTGKEFELPKQRGIDAWHTYALEWEPGELRWYVDGQLYQTQNQWYSKRKDNATNFSYPAPFDQEFHLLLNLAVGGHFDGDPDGTTIFPKTMEIDYVRVYDLKKREYREPVEPIIEKTPLPENAKHPQADGNLIYDSQYEEPITDIGVGGIELNPLYWNFVHQPEFGGQGTITTERLDGTTYAKTSITNPGNQLYSLQLIQNLSLGIGRTYKVSFDAKSTDNRNMMVKVGGGESRGWGKYSNEETIKLTDQLQSYEFTFDMLVDTDIAARLEFNLGGNGTNPVWIGNVRVEEVDQLENQNLPKQPLPDGNHVYNGTFDQGSMDRMTYWNFDTNGADAKASVDEGTRELKIAISNGGDHYSKVQLIQKGMSLIQGNGYKAIFKARADEPRAIEVDFRSKDSNISYSGGHLVDLTQEMNEYTIEFKMPEAITDSEGQFIFNLGGQNGNVFIDDVVLLKTTNPIDYGNVDLYPLKNGDFSNGLEAWGSYVHFDANATISEQNGEAKVAITQEGNETWSVIFEQGQLKLSKDVEYIVSFDARTTKPRNVELTVENAAYTRFLSKEISLTDEMETYSYEFKMNSDDVAGLKFLLGKQKGDVLGAHDVYIDNVIFQVKNLPEQTQKTPGIDNGTFENGDEH